MNHGEQERRGQKAQGEAAAPGQGPQHVAAEEDLLGQRQQHHEPRGQVQCRAGLGQHLADPGLLLRAEPELS